jgi:hypothetical protein
VFVIGLPSTTLPGGFGAVLAALTAAALAIAARKLTAVMTNGVKRGFLRSLDTCEQKLDTAGTEVDCADPSKRWFSVEKKKMKFYVICSVEKIVNYKIYDMFLFVLEQCTRFVLH